MNARAMYSDEAYERLVNAVTGFDVRCTGEGKHVTPEATAYRTPCIMTLDDDAFAPLDDFPLLSRWAPAVLREIRPLTRQAAARLAPDAIARCRASATADWTIVITAEPERREPVRARLQALPIDGDTPVLVSWHRDVAVLVPWRVFAEHWTDFCHPATEEVTVWQPGQPWTLCYHHFGVFEFGTTA